MPGVGISIGLTRLIPELIRTNVLKANRKTVAEVLVTNAMPARTAEYVKLAANLRDAGIKTEVYLEERRLVKQVEFANKKGVKFILIQAEAEVAGGFVTIKNMDTGEQVPVKTDNVISYLKHQLSSPSPNPILN
jgi:histidyl-tRNA synthetase